MDDKTTSAKFWKLVATIVGTALTFCAAVFLIIGSRSRYKSTFGVACAFFGLVFIVLMKISRQAGKEAEIHSVNRELQNQAPGHSQVDVNHDADI